MMRTILYPVLAALLLPLFLPGAVQAHKVNLFTYYEDGFVFIESYFPDGTACRNSRILARDESGAVVAEGVTDNDGLFSFPFENAGVLNISLNAGDGHGAETTLKIEEKIREAPVEPVAEFPPQTADIANDLKIPAADEEALGRIVEEKIAPLQQSVREIRMRLEKPGLDKVMGGLGWIVGLAGAYLWGASRRRGKEN